MILKIKYIYPFLSMLLLSLFSCSFETAATHRMDAELELASYIVENEIDVKPTASGLLFIKQRDGNGVTPLKDAKVAIHYTGMFLNGEVFDSSYDRGTPMVFQLSKNQVIKGLEEAVLMIDKGARARIVVPYHLAYGDRRVGPVPSYSNLVFDVELIDCQGTNDK